MRFVKKIVLLPIVALALVAGLAFNDPFFELQKNVELYLSVLKNLHIYYVDKTDDAALIKNSIETMLEGLDPYTVFYPESDMEDYRFMTTGEYGGIGAGVELRDAKFIVTEPAEGYAAQKSGLRAGDEIVKIEGQSLAGRSLDEASKLLKGRPGTAVRLLLRRNDKSFEHLVVREKIVVPNVPYFKLLDAKYGYIKHAGFTESAAEELRQALLTLKSQGATSIILDLRGNPGGLLGEAVDIVNLLVPQDKLVVDTRGKVKEWNRSFRTRNKPVDETIPVAVLINSTSASAAEIVSGALQDYDRAVVLGRRSFGKGLVQTTLDLPYNTKMKITTAKYYIPSGRCIQALDYSHRRPDGSVGHVPDSLVSEFRTQNGRPVYDGGGVMPDVEINEFLLSSFTNQLVDNYVFFDFATLYRSRVDSLADYAGFVVDQTLYQEFKAFVKQRKLRFSTESQKALAEFEKVMQREKYHAVIKTQIDQIQARLAPDPDKDLELYREEISWVLKEEIVSRYGFQTGRIEASLAHDPDVARAKKLLDNPAEYQKILAKK